jgi:hypothetical protein
VDTESIAREIVQIKNRLQELDEHVEGSSETDIDDERKTLVDRMRHLQDQLSGHGAAENGKHDAPASPQGANYVKPA